jgi:hypothetical protein
VCLTHARRQRVHQRRIPHVCNIVIHVHPIKFESTQSFWIRSIYFMRFFFRRNFYKNVLLTSFRPCM